MLDKLTVRFGGLTAVEDVDCAVDERQIYSIIGPNGAGKTTVFNAITGIYEPTAGTIDFAAASSHGRSPGKCCGRGLRWAWPPAWPRR